MVKIYITRHGQNFDNKNQILGGHRNEPLTSIGIKQGLTLAEKIRNKRLEFDAVYVSPLRRCRQLAYILCGKLQLPRAQILPQLIERDFGIMTGRGLSEIEVLCTPHILRTEKVTYFLSPRNGEDFKTLRVRAEKVLNLIYANHSEGSVLLVAHGDIGLMLFAVFHGLKCKNALSRFHFGNCDLIQLVKGKPHKPHIIRIDQHN